MENLAGDPVSDAESFFRIAAAQCKKIEVLFMAAGDIQKCQSQLDEHWQLVTSLPKTHQTHCVEPVFKYVVSASMYSTAEQFELVSLHPECHVSSLECQNTASPAPAERPRSDSQPQVHPGDFVTVQYVTKKI